MGSEWNWANPAGGNTSWTTESIESWQKENGTEAAGKAGKAGKAGRKEVGKFFGYEPTRVC